MSRPAGECVVASQSVERVVAQAPAEGVLPVSTNQDIVPLIAVQQIVTVTALERVVAEIAKNQVIATIASQCFGSRRSDQDIAARRPDQRIGKRVERRKERCRHRKPEHLDNRCAGELVGNRDPHLAIQIHDQIVRVSIDTSRAKGADGISQFDGIDATRVGNYVVPETDRPQAELVGIITQAAVERVIDSTTDATVQGVIACCSVTRCHDPLLSLKSITGR